MSKDPFTSEFWRRVLKCEHKHLSKTYSPWVRCDTPYCSAGEDHCLDCGVYITSCQCGANNGMSGWSHARWNTHWRKWEEKRMEKLLDE